MTATTAAAVAAGFCMWFVTGVGAAADARLRRLTPSSYRSTVRFSWPSPAKASFAVGCATAVVASLVLGLAAVLPTAVASGEAVRRLLRARRDRSAQMLRDEIAEWCAAVATELRIGRTADEAMAVVTEQSGTVLPQAVGPVLAIARLGGDVSAAFIRASEACEGADALRLVGACWSVAGETGAGLATALHKLGDGLQARQRLRAEVQAQLASARATARLLAVLPVFGLVLGQAVGARPVHFLLHTFAGAVCLAATVVLNAVGLLWTDRIAARVPLP